MRKDDFFEKVLSEIAQQCPWPHHNRRYTEEVVERVTELAHHVRPPLGERDVELLGLAALFHGFGHCGRTIRQTCPGASHTNMSNEEFAALEAERQLSSKLDSHELTVVKRMILATSFGQNNPTFAYYRPYEPVTLLEKLLAFADIAGFQKSFEEWMDESFRVMQEADPATVPETFEAWLKTRNGFLGYCRVKLDKIVPALDPDYASCLSSKLYTMVFALTDGSEAFRGHFEAVRISRRGT